MTDAGDLITVEQAFFDILYSLMLADGHADVKEGLVVREFLKQEHIARQTVYSDGRPFFQESNYLVELGLLQNLGPRALERRCALAVDIVAEWISPADQAHVLKEDLVKYGVKLVSSDGKIVPEEAAILNVLKDKWGIDWKKHI